MSHPCVGISSIDIYQDFAGGEVLPNGSLVVPSINESRAIQIPCNKHCQDSLRVFRFVTVIVRSENNLQETKQTKLIKNWNLIFQHSNCDEAPRLSYKILI